MAITDASSGESCLRPILEHTDDLVVVIGEDLTCRALSASAAARHHVQDDQIVGKPIARALPTEPADLLAGKIRAVLDGHKPDRFDMEVILNGHRGLYSAILSLVPAENGHSRQVVCIAHPTRPDNASGSLEDVDQAEQPRGVGAALEANPAANPIETERIMDEESFRSMTLDLPVGLFRNTAGAVGTFLMASKATAQMYGYSSVDALGTISVASLYADPTERKLFSDKLRSQGYVLAEELRLKRRDGTLFWGAVSARAILDKSGVVRYFDGVIEDITTRKEAKLKLEQAYEELEAKVQQRTSELQDANKQLRKEVRKHERVERTLRESEERFRTFLDDLTDTVYRADTEGTVTYVNKHAEELTGLAIKDIVDKPILPFLAEENRPAAVNSYERTLEGESTEFELRLANGKICRFRQKPLRDENGGIVGILGMVRDVTEHRQAQQALQASEEQLRLLMENAPSLIVTVDRNGTIQFINRTMTGVPTEEVIGQNASDDFLHPEYRDLARDVIDSVFRTGHVGRYEARAEISGRDCWLDTQVGPLKRDGKVEAAMLSVSDITQRKKAEERIRLLSSAFRQSAEGLAVVDLSGNIIELNDAFATVHGYSPEELIGKNLSVFHSSEQMVSVAAARSHIKQTGEFAGEIWHMHRDGTVFPTHMRNSLLRDENGQAIGTIETLRDITELKRHEDALRESEARYRAVVEDETELICRFSPDTTLTLVNGALCLYHGLPRDELIGSSFLSLIHTEDQDRVKGLLDSLRPEDPLANLTHPSLNANEETRWVQWRIRGLFGDQDRLVQIQATGNDITDRKRAEDMLRLQRDLGISLSATIDLSTAHDEFLETALSIDGIDSGAVYLVERETGQVALASHKGESNEVGKIVSSFDADSREATLIAEGRPVYMTREELKSVSNATGENAEIRYLGVIPFLHEGQVRGSLNVASHTCDDIPASTRDTLEAIATQIGAVIGRMEAEDALRNSEERYRGLIEHGADLIAVLDEDGSFLYASPSIPDQLGHDPSELVGRSGLDLIHPDDEPAMRAALARGNKKPGNVTTVEFRFKHKDGSWRVLDATSTNLLHVPAIRGTVINARDITESRAAQEASLVFSRSIEQSSDPILITDADLLITFANNAAGGLLGQATSKMAGRSLGDFCRVDPEVAGERWQTLMDDRRWSGTCEIHDSNGRDHMANLNSILICDASDSPIATVNLLPNVTESKRLASLREVTDAIVRTETTDSEVIQEIMAHLPELVGVEQWTIYIHNSKQDVLEMLYCSKTSKEVAKLFPTIPVSGTIHGDVLKTGQIEYSPDILSNPRFSKSATFRQIKSAASLDMRAVCLLPLRSGDRVFGTLNVSDHRVRIFTAEELNILKTLANQLSRLLSPLVSQRPSQDSPKPRRATKAVPIVAESEPMKVVLRSAQRIAATNMPSVILGPTGAGKGHLAKHIHSISARADGPFLAVNCACLDGELILSELFGHERGAFTGAVRQQKGCFELANGGTLLLDEVVELPLSAQAKLLQLVETQRFRRLGGQGTIITDVRLICTTNTDIRECVRTGRLRQDLYYRLSAGEIVVPPLSARRRDIQPLSQAHLRTQALVMNQPPCQITAGALARLREYHWPGNIRELQNVLSMAMSHGGQIIGATDLQFAPADIRIPRPAPRGGDNGDERETILQALRRNRWNRTLAADELGVHRNTLRNRMRKYNIAQ